jgi:hypothetical protein
MNACLGSSAASVIFCECGNAGRREESAGLTVVADLQMQLCSRAREGAPHRIWHISAFVGTLRLRTRWWPHGARNMVDEKRIARVVGLALGSVFLAGLFLNALT